MPETLTQLRTRRLALSAEVIELAGQDDLSDEQEAEFAAKTADLAKIHWPWRARRPLRP